MTRADGDGPGRPTDAPLPEPQETVSTSVDARLRERLVRFAARLVGPACAEDVVHEALTQAEERAPRAVSPRAWLFTVTRRRALDRLRRRARDERATAHLLAAPAPDPAPAAADEAARREELARVARALESVPEPFRTAVRLRYLEGLSFAELAQRTDALERTARGRVARGLAALRAHLEPDA